MVFNCSLIFEFGYPHTLVQMDREGCRPFVGISSGMGHWDGRATKISHKSGLIQQERTPEYNNESMEFGYDERIASSLTYLVIYMQLIIFEELEDK